MSSILTEPYSNNAPAGESHGSAALFCSSHLPSPERLDINIMPGVEPDGLSWVNGEPNCQPRGDCVLSRTQRYIE